MQRRHRTLLSNNHEFLISEIPMDATLEAIQRKGILNWHDFEQLKTLRHQGRRALARYLLAVLPQRGPQAFQAFLESLQEANCQHLVDLLLQQSGAMSLENLLKTPPPGDENDLRGHAKTPSDTPLPPGPDPHEYAIRLTRNSRYIRKFVDPADVSPLLLQNKIITSREADMVTHLNGRNKKWDLIMAALLQRGERAFQAFMAALLQKDYTAVFHAVQETSTDPSSSDDEKEYPSDNSNEDHNLESDEEIKAETNKIRQRNSLADGILHDSTLKRNSAVDGDALLQRSRDLMETGHVVQLAAHTSRKSLNSHDDDN